MTSVVLYLTHRVRYTWPMEYVNEFVRKAKRKNLHVHVISDDTDEEVAKEAIGGCAYFVGVPNQFDGLPTNGKRIVLRGATLKGEGPVSSAQCAGCAESIKDSIDCLWEDSLCMEEISPNDVLEAMCLE